MSTNKEMWPGEMSTNEEMRPAEMSTNEKMRQGEMSTRLGNVGGRNVYELGIAAGRNVYEIWKCGRAKRLRMKKSGLPKCLPIMLFIHRHFGAYKSRNVYENQK